MLKNILMLEVEKKKKKRDPAGLKKILVMKIEAILNDDTEEFLEKIKEQKKNKREEEEEQPKKKEVNSGYWSTPIKPKEEEEKQTIEKEVETEKSFGPEEWIKTERDYIYNELVERIYGTLKTKNPQLCTEKKIKELQ